MQNGAKMEKRPLSGSMDKKVTGGHYVNVIVLRPFGRGLPRFRKFTHVEEVYRVPVQRGCRRIRRSRPCASRLNRRHRPPPPAILNPRFRGRATTGDPSRQSLPGSRAPVHPKGDGFGAPRTGGQSILQDRFQPSREEVTFVDIDAWGKQNQLIAQYLRKEIPVRGGRLKLDQWDDKTSGRSRSAIPCGHGTSSFWADAPKGVPTSVPSRPLAPASLRLPLPAGFRCRRSSPEEDDVPFLIFPYRPLSIASIYARNPKSSSSKANVVAWAARSDHVAGLRRIRPVFLIPQGLPLPVTQGQQRSGLRTSASAAPSVKPRSSAERGSREPVRRDPDPRGQDAGDDGKVFGSITSGSHRGRDSRRSSACPSTSGRSIWKPIHALANTRSNCGLHADVRAAV